MSHLFISYAREDREFVVRLHQALEKRQRSTWVDWEGIPPTVEWLSEIYRAIDAAEAFVFVLTPDSVASEICGKELQQAIEQNKRLIPLVLREADGEAISDSIRQLNWIFIQDEDDFEVGIDTLIEAVNTDLERVRAHTRLLVRAREWEARSHHSLLLRSRDLAEAERQFIGGAELEPRPTALQLRYLTSSRKRSAKIQRIMLGAVTGGMVIAIALAVLAWIQREYSERRSAAAFVQNIATAKPMIALAHAVNEMGQLFSDDVPEVRSSLLSALQLPKEHTIYELDEKWPIASVALVPNGSVVAALDSRFVNDPSRALVVWDSLSNPQPFGALDTAITAVASCSVEPIILIGGEDGSLRLWDLQAGEELQVALADSERSTVPTLGVKKRGVPPASTYDTQYAEPGLNVYGSRPTPAERVDAEPAHCPYSPTAVRIAALSSDCTTIAVVRGCATEVWSRSPDLRLMGRLREMSAPQTVAIDQTGRTIARGYLDGSIRRATSPATRVAFVDAEVARNPAGNPAESLAISPDGRQIVSGDGNTVRLWRDNGTTFDQVGDGFHGHDDRVTAVCFDPVANAFVVSGGRDNSIRVWGLEGNQIGEPRQGHDSWIRSILISSDGLSIVSGSNDGTIRRWDARSNFTQLPCRNIDGPVEVLAVSEDGEITLIHAKDEATGMSEVYSQNRECDRQLEARGEVKQLAALTPDGRFIAYGGQGGSTIRMRDRAADRKEAVIAHPEGGLRAIAISPNGGLLAFGGNDRIVRMWSRTDSGFREFANEHDLPIISLAFSFDGRTIASGSEDNTVQLWNVESGERQGQRLQGHIGWISSVTFSHTGHYIATGSWDRTVRLWDREGNSMGRQLRGHTNWITHVRFRREDASVISYGSDKRIGIWQGGMPSDWLRESCRQLNGHPGVKEAEENEIYERAKATCSRL